MRVSKSEAWLAKMYPVCLVGVYTTRLEGWGGVVSFLTSFTTTLYQKKDAFIFPYPETLYNLHIIFWCHSLHYTAFS